MTTELDRTPLYNWHVAHGGRMVDFAGWSMPVQYTSIAEEHHATRRAVGVFDISHMGRLAINGPDASAFLDCMLTRRVDDMCDGQIRYSLVCNADGGTLDDVLVYLTGRDDENFPSYALVVNAGNRAKIMEWLKDRANEFAVRIADSTTGSAMLAVQGPKAVGLVDLVSQGAVSRLKYFYGASCEVAGVDCYVSRSGYTGEDGCEIICDGRSAEGIWDRIVAAAKAADGRVAGLGARDTLRLEAAMPLYGHELSEGINPIQAGLEFAVNLKDREFIGRDALARIAADTKQPVRVGLQLDGKRVPRQGCAVLQGDERIGEVTSGTYSPTLDRPIAMAYVRPAAQAIGTRLSVDIRGTQHAAVVVPLPFYRRTKAN